MLIYIRYQMFATATFKPSAQLMEDIFDTLNATLSAFSPAGGITWVVALEPLAAAMLSGSGSAPKDVLGVGRKDNGFSTLDISFGQATLIKLTRTNLSSFEVMLLSSSWSNAASTGEVQYTARHVMALLESQAERNGLLGRFQYLNYAAPYQDPFKSYGKDNLAFLRKVSREYDPENVFQEQVPGGFKLW